MKSEAEAIEKLGFLASIKDVPVGHLQKLHEAAPSSTILMTGKPLAVLNELLVRYKLSTVSAKKDFFDFDDNIPF